MTGKLNQNSLPVESLLLDGVKFFRIERFANQDFAILGHKLIVTRDAELANQIIKETNRQTKIKLEEFESFSPFHRILEEFYGSCGEDSTKRLFYERLSKQLSRTQISLTAIVSSNPIPSHFSECP